MKKFLTALVVLLVACGKRGDPHPPIPIIPKATTDLVVAQRGAKVLLAWGYPALTTAGKNLSNVRRVVVYRATEPLPVVQPPEPNITTTPQPIAAFAKVPPLTPAQFVKLRTRVDSIEGANLPAASAGALLTFEDTPPFHTTDGRPVRLTYAVITEGPNATGDLSNLASIVPLDVPVPPPALTATPKAEGVILTWTAPATSITSKAKPAIIGYNAYRVGEGETLTEQTKPGNASPVSATTYTDVPPYGKFTYVVTAVAAAHIESDPSPPATVTFKDLMPPPQPKNVEYLLETKAIRLIWEPVDAPDLAGYRLFRTEGAGHEPDIREAGTIPLQPLVVPAPYYVDARAEVGIAYKYGVASVDKSGNASAPVWTGWVIVPKTP